MELTVKERLADYAHDTWSGWMRYMFSKSEINDDGSVTIPKSLVERWSRQMNTAYDELPEDEKRSDRDEADKMIAIGTLLAGAPPEEGSYVTCHSCGGSGKHDDGRGRPASEWEECTSCGGSGEMFE